MIAGSVVALLKADTKEWQAGMVSAAKDADTLHKKSTNSFKNTIKEMNALFGKKSMLGLSLKIAAGGGAIAGIHMAEQQLDDLAKKFTQFQLGRLDTKDLVASIPVIGGLINTEINLLDAFSGRAAARIQAEEEASHLAGIYSAHQAAAAHQMEEQVRSTKEWADIVQKVYDERKLSDLSGIKKQEEESRQKTRDNLKSQQEKFEGSDSAKALKKVEGELRAIQWADDVLSRQASRVRKRMSQDIDPFTRQELSTQLDEIAKQRAEWKKKGGEAKDKGNYWELKKGVEADKGKMENAQWVTAAKGAHDILGIYTKEYGDMYAKLGPRLAQLRNRALDAAVKGAGSGLTGDMAGGALAMGKLLGLKPDTSEIQKEFAAGKSMHEGLRTAAEKYADELKNIQDLKKKGMLTDQDAARALVRARADYGAEAAREGPPKAVQHSIEAREQRIRGFGNDVVAADPKIADPIENLNKTADEQLKAAQEQLKISQKQLDEAKNAMKGKVVVNF